MTTPNYHGWAESDEAAQSRSIRKEINHTAYCIQTERDADLVREIVDGLEGGMYTRHPDLFNEQAQDAEWLGTHTVISGGEVLELGPQAGGEIVF